MPQGMKTALRRGLVLAAAGGLMVIPISGTSQAADTPGMRKAPPSIAKAVIADIVPGAKVKCMRVQLTKSSNAWGAYGPKNRPPAGCPAPGDAPVIFAKKAGTWTPIPIANDAQCEDIGEALKDAGASKSVQRDILKGLLTC